MALDTLRHIDAVARYLPFGIDDYEAANAAFMAVARDQRREGARDCGPVGVLLHPEVLHHPFPEGTGQPSEFDRCISLSVRRVRGSYERIDDTSRFASYVSVTCKNTLRNHRRDRREMAEMTEYTGTVEPEPLHDHDGPLIRYVIAEALLDMPEAIRWVGQLRLLDGMEYEAIAEETGHALPTVRTYAARAMNRLRSNEKVRALYFDDILPPEARPSGNHETHVDE